MSRFDIIDPIAPSAQNSIGGILGNLNAEADRNVQLAQIAAQAQIAKSQIDAQQTMQKAGIEADVARQESGQAFQDEQLALDRQAEMEQQGAMIAAQQQEDSLRRKQVDDQFAVAQEKQEQARRDNLLVQKALLEGRVESVPAAKKAWTASTKRMQEEMTKGNALAFLLDSETTLSEGAGGKMLEDAESWAVGDELTGAAIAEDVKSSIDKALAVSVLDKTDGGKYELVDPKKLDSIPGRFGEATRLTHSVIDRLTDRALGTSAEAKKGLIKEYVSAVMMAGQNMASASEFASDTGYVEGLNRANEGFKEKAEGIRAQLEEMGLSTRDLHRIVGAIDDEFSTRETAAIEQSAGKVLESGGDLDRKGRKVVDQGKKLASVYQYAGNLRSFATSAGLPSDVGNPKDIIDAIDTAAVTYSLLSSPDEFREWAIKTIGPKARDPKLLARWEKRRADAVAKMQANRKSRNVAPDADLIGDKQASDAAMAELLAGREDVMGELGGVEAQRGLDVINQLLSE